MSHTKGKWKYEITNATENKLDILIQSQENITIGWVYADEEGEANARLIASAPDMLEALIELLRDSINNYPNMPNNHRKTWHEYYSDEIQVIEQATGKTIDEVLKDGRKE